MLVRELERPIGNGSGDVADLEIALASVRDRIAKFRGQAIGEENTKHALIEPVLKALGWNVEDLDEVRCEYKFKQADNPVDYALFANGNLRLFVEAKALGENLDKPAVQSQIMGYAGVAGVAWIVVTDGNQYRIYNAAAMVPIDQKLFKHVVLASDEPRDVQSVLLLLSKAEQSPPVIDDLWLQYFVDRQVKQAVEGLSGIDPPMDFLHLIRKRVPTLSLAELRQSLGRATLSLQYRPSQPSAPPAVYKAPTQLTAGVGAVQVEQSAEVDKTPWRHVTLGDLISAGTIRLPLDIETAYKGHQLTARIEPDGNVTWNGTTYDSLSVAGGMARKSIVGAPPGREYPPTNGWTFWRFRDTDGRLAFVDMLRQRYSPR
jgi:Restriction Enzyme Adenine Methylase Associated/Type I restriction enzyme R protein N terminus (HSDR_N)